MGGTYTGGASSATSSIWTLRGRPLGFGAGFSFGAALGGRPRFFLLAAPQCLLSLARVLVRKRAGAVGGLPLRRSALQEGLALPPPLGGLRGRFAFQAQFLQRKSFIQ